MIAKAYNWLSANREKWLVLTDQAIVSGVNFVVGILLARFLGIEAYGFFALAWMVVLFASGLQQAFIVSPLYSLTSKQDDKARWFNQLSAIQFIVSIAAGFISFGVVNITWAFKPEWQIPYTDWIIAALVAGFLMNDFLRRLGFIQHQPKQVVIMDLLGYGLQPLMLFALHYLEALTLNRALVVVFIAQTLSIAFTLISGRIQFEWAGISEVVKKLWSFSRYLIGTALLQWFSGNYFILAAGTLLGPAAVGAVRIAQNIMGVLHVLFIAMENIVPIRAAEHLNDSGVQRMMHYMRRISIQALLPTGLLLLSIAIFREQLLEALYGATYLAHANVLLAFCGIYLFVFIGTQLRFVIRTVNRNQLIFWSYIITTVLSVSTANIIIQTFEEMGIIIGIAWMQVVTLIFYVIFLKKELKWLFK